MRWCTRASDDESRLAILDIVSTPAKSIIFVDKKTHHRFLIMVDRLTSFSMKGIYIDMLRQDVYQHGFHNVCLDHPVVYVDEWTSVILKLHSMFHISSIVCMNTMWVHQYRHALSAIVVDHETDVDDMLSLNVETNVTTTYPDRVIISQHVDPEFYLKVFEYHSAAHHILLDMPTLDPIDAFLINHIALSHGYSFKYLHRDNRFTVNLFTRVVKPYADNCEDVELYQS